ncbi:MAG: PilT/PilU family type 4a pilus ATPase [Candidatus Hydrogenedentes bacterium]|nr:PilT/PilU family type 4a pilus ATPase [Candidatus Hydrogenedentota bacterium]
MAEFILGVGQHKTVFEVMALATEQLQRVEGQPRKVAARSDTAEIEATRADFEGEFDSYILRLRDADSLGTALEGVLSEYQDVLSRSEEDGWHVVQFSRAGDGAARAADAVARLGRDVPLPEIWRVHGEDYRVDRISAELLFQAMLQYKASDVHLSPGQSPVFRVDNEIRTSELLGALSATQIRTLIRDVASDADWKEFTESMQASFNYHQVGLGYSRVSCFVKLGAPHCTFRFLPEVVPSFEDLSIPGDTMVALAKQHHGLILVTGMTGSGKSTTVAALVDWINSNKACHILTIENPVEYVHKNKKAVVSQRSTGTDVATFFDAVTGALRHDPDVIVIGEMRDPDTIRSAISAAATGHLVISTLHSNTASEVVNRIVSFFDPVERDLIKLQLRDCLRCVICQRLVPKTGGGRIPALEVMVNDIKPINASIIAGDTDGIRIGMQQTVSHSFLFESYLFGLYKQGKISLENARTYTTDQSVLDQMVMGTYSVPRLESIKTARAEGSH